MEAINLTCSAATFVLALALGSQVLAGGPVSLWNGFLYADHLSALVILLTASVALVRAPSTPSAICATTSTAGRSPARTTATQPSRSSAGTTP